MDYKKHYDLLIESRKNRKLIDGEYYEIHHITPKSMGGTNKPSNLIKLTAREHFIAHWLLWRIHQNSEMAFAFYCLTYMSKNQKVKSSRIYEECKLARRPFIVENNKKYHKGKKLSKEQIENIQKVFKNLVRTESHRQNISESLKNKPKSDIHKQNLSKSLKGYDWTNYSVRNKKISDSNSGEKNGNAKNVQINEINGEFSKIFTTMNEAMNFICSNTSQKIPKTTFWRKCKKGSTIEKFYVSFC
jgi:hypothetical protein